MSSVKKLIRKLTRRFKVQTGLSSAVKSKKNRRHPRIRLTDGRVTFTRFEGQELGIYNISCSGVAFRLNDFKKLPSPGDFFEGVLRVGKTSFEIECFVVHIAGPLVGCEFTDDTFELESVLKAAFELEMRALNLIKVRQDILTPRETGVPYYFHGGDKDELYYVVNKSEIPHFVLIFNGEYVEGGSQHSLKMGKLKVQIKNHSADPGLLYPVDLYNETDGQVLNLAKTFLDNIEGLDSAHREAMKKHLKS